MANLARGDNSRESCSGGLAQSSARTNSSVATRRRRSIWVNRRCYSSVRAVACETRHLAAAQISAQTEWCDRVRKFERSVIPLMQLGERCHWLEAERITGTGVWLGRRATSDAHLIGTPGGVIQVRTVRRLTREQRGDDVSKRAFDNFIGSPRNISGSKPSLEEQTAHGEKWTLTPGCKGCIWARRECHHTKACKARKRASATEPPRSATPSGSARDEGAQPEPVDEQPQPKPDVGDSDMVARQTLKRLGGRVS